MKKSYHNLFSSRVMFRRKFCANGLNFRLYRYNISYPFFVDFLFGLRMSVSFPSHRRTVKHRKQTTFDVENPASLPLRGRGTALAGDEESAYLPIIRYGIDRKSYFPSKSHPHEIHLYNSPACSPHPSASPPPSPLGKACRADVFHNGRPHSTWRTPRAFPCGEGGPR